jgi:hypothetical protein
MKRRYFLLAGFAAACAVAGWRFLRSTEESAIAKVVHKKLAYLKLDAPGVQRFASDLAASKTISHGRLRILDAAGPFYTGLALSADNAIDKGIRHGEDKVITLFLLSSDFFKNGADQTREVHYVSLYDPVVACSNPLARPVIVPTSA